MQTTTVSTARVNNIDGTALNGTTALLINNSGKDVFVINVIPIARTISAPISAPIISLGSNAGINNILGATALSATLAAAGDALSLANPLSFAGVRVANGSTLSAKITTAAVAGTYTFDLLVVAIPA